MKQQTKDNLELALATIVGGIAIVVAVVVGLYVKSFLGF